MKLPFLGIELKIENVEVTNSQLTAQSNVSKKLYFQDEKNDLKNCNLRCEKSECDGSCEKNVTMSDFANGKLQILYIK